MPQRRVFISGGTGYIGQALVRELLDRGHAVRVLARPASAGKVDPRAEAVPGDALRAESFAARVAPSDTFVHLTGVAHPAPWKEREFRAIDLASLRASAEAAKSAGVAHFVYVSVAQPAPVMKAYIRVRSECEAILARHGLPRTILRPWYVLGPGRSWPAVMKPIYALFEALPGTRERALRLGLVTREQMTRALLWAVEHPVADVRIVDVAAIRDLGADPPAAPLTKPA
jgi:uncharacterized protein YbjT (DUF2867 family)